MDGNAHMLPIMELIQFLLLAEVVLIIHGQPLSSTDNDTLGRIAPQVLIVSMVGSSSHEDSTHRYQRPNCRTI
jgi:hypothetical protein